MRDLQIHKSEDAAIVARNMSRSPCIMDEKIEKVKRQIDQDLIPSDGTP